MNMDARGLLLVFSLTCLYTVPAHQLNLVKGALRNLVSGPLLFMDMPVFNI
jgi:hypothetical protein